MKRLCRVSLILLASTASLGQTPTLRTGTQIVVVDVTVTGKDGKPVSGLDASSFILEEDGVAQKLRFEPHTVPSAEQLNKLPSRPNLPPGVFTNFTPVTADLPLNIVLLDTLNTPHNDQLYLRNQLIEYLKTLQPGSRVAIFGLSSRLYLLQGFTSDPKLLLAAFDPKAFFHRTSSYVRDTPGSDKVVDQMSASFAGETGSMAMQWMEKMLNDNKSVDASLDQNRMRSTLNAMNQMARYLSAFPGRKNLIWFSGSFPLNLFPDGAIQDPFAPLASSEGDFRETTNLLTRAQVAVYPVDARGLFLPRNYDATFSGARYQAGRSSAFESEVGQLATQSADDRLTMEQMAEATGGRAFVASNDLTSATRSAIEDGSNYYTLSYTPSNQKWNGAYRKIRVRTSQPGVHLSYRRGYFAFDPYKPATTESRRSTAAAHAQPLSPVRSAMLLGAPPPTQIVFKAQLQTAAPSLDKPTEGTDLNSGAKGPFRQLTINYATPAASVQLPPTEQGDYQLSLRFFAIAYDRNGKAIATAVNPVAITMKQQYYDTLQHSGVQYTQQFSVPKNETAFVRIGMQDELGNRIGALELPITAIP